MREDLKIWQDREGVYLTRFAEGDGKADGGKKPAAIVCPGGGYMVIADSEGAPVAEKFLQSGYRAFVLHYSTIKTGGSVFPSPVCDLAQAILIIRENADKWGVDADKIIVCGFSAGGHVAASLGVLWNSAAITERLKGLTDAKLINPAAMVLCYAVLDETIMGRGEGGDDDVNIATFGHAKPSDEELIAASPAAHVGAHTPPAFIWHTSADDDVPAVGSLDFGIKLAAHGVPYEVHVFEQGGHALSLCDETTVRKKEHLGYTCSAWFGLALAWLESRGL